MSIRFCSFSFLLKSSVYKLITPFECKPQHSYSSILATSQFLLQNFAQMTPPLDEEQKQQIKQHTQVYYNPLIQFWNDYLTECAVQQLALRYQDQFYILIPVDSIPINSLENNPLLAQVQYQKEWDELGNQEKTARIFSVPFQEIKREKKIGIYMTHPITKPKYYPRINMSAIFLGILFNNEKWQIFDIPKGQLPQEKYIQTFDSIIITGSYYSVLEQSKQISVSLQRLMQAYHHSNKLKIVGICYGHQLLCYHFGATVVKKTLKAELEMVNFDQKIVEKHSFLDFIQNHIPLTLIELHQDYVETVPQNFELLGWSQSSKVEATISKDGRILTTQFHSQLLYTYCQNMQKTLENFQDSLNLKIEDSKQTIEKSTNDSVLFLEAIRKYIDS